jgi:YHS domain-containing protein
MTRPALAVLFGTLLACTADSGPAAQTRDDEAPARDIPAAFAPLEYLVGEWKGQGIPKDNSAQQFRGWSEKHAWAWIFDKGKPSALSFTIDGGKFLASGKLTFIPERKVYRLEGKEADTRHTAISFEGKFDDSGKLLVLERVRKKEKSAPEGDSMRISLRPNANFLRYTMTQDLKPAGAVQFARAVEVGVTKEGETFAAGAAATERPKCIVTGGQATLSVTFEGQTFPLCCSGCLGEFNDNPQKYVKKAALLLTGDGAKSKSDSPARARGRDDAFASDVVEPSPATAPKAKQKAMPAAKKTAGADKNDEATTSAADAKDKDKPAAKKDATKPADSKASRAATLVRLGRTLERSGKTDAALTNYRRVVKDFAGTPAAKTAAERIKALEKE